MAHSTRCVCGTQYREMGLSGTTHSSSRCHFSQSAQFCVQLFSPFQECAFSAVRANTFPALASDYICAAGGTSGDCCGRASCEFSARRDLRSAGSSHRVCDASSDGQYVAPALPIRSASTSARGRGTCTCEEVRGTWTSGDLRDVHAAVPCRVHHGSRHDRRKPGPHVLGRFNISPLRLLRCCDTRIPWTSWATWIRNSPLLRL